ncbi:MAG: amino acid permease, partial [Myxococcota bacterium]
MQQVTVDVASAGAAPAKKFGTLLGVYTPSILTILGVIMYQRFGWVVGHAGLAQTLIIVLLAHVISITTGLSVASIATNHTVKTGGNYYIISRSLGLSIGGAIGVALYLALTLGVSLYLIGFAEAFLAAVPGSPTGDPRNDIRLVGTVACAGISLLTLYSTDFALKSQLFVLVAIVLSLISIVFGTPVPFEPGETAVGMTPPAGGFGFETVFAVFFPAVTGFTAGVGMSGDLKDPKRSIPIGTMAAIFTGMFIYLVMPPFLANAASVEQLQADKNILLRVAAVPELVTLGVFSATLSSALGSILGAPRTLQALAFDGIVPRVLGRGQQEPRLALFVTILIAEAGILVAELELVGAVISMFFLTSYGFLCLACGLERWASPDFRPQFKVPIWVSLLGAVAAFVVMAQIDVLAMAGAISMMAVLYFFLKRRQLVLGSGDTWGGVWSAVVRMGLMRLRASASRAHTRNWRPN